MAPFDPSAVVYLAQNAEYISEILRRDSDVLMTLGSNAAASMRIRILAVSRSIWR